MAHLYIAYLGEKKHDDPTLVTASHHDMLSSIIGSKDEASASFAYSYKHGFSGFAAMLTEDQAEHLAELPEVISITPNQKHELTTTRSWDFLGLNLEPPSELLQRSNYGEDIIIGIIDSGIWPESKSFSDHGYDAIPSRWKGVCQLGQAWGPSNCSRKIIGARYYVAGLDKANFKNNYMSARDNNGHGTHTASTAAGAVVEGVNLHGLGAGVARGGAPRARLAVYKVGWEEGGGEIYLATASVLAALDDAIHDGVDILSLSITADEDSFGALHAVQKGITVVYAGGNYGPRPQVLINTAPWVITVAASKIDRSFPTTITLGNKRTLVGQSLYDKLKNETKSKFESLINGGNCSREVLNGASINGKVVLCIEKTFGPTTKFYKDVIVRVIQGGASGLIFALYTTDVLLSTEGSQGIPCVIVDNEIGFQVATYIGTERFPTVKIEPANSITGIQVPAPKVAIFSSRGPSIKYPTVLKPDIAAPGVNILAAKGDAYVFNSGTSMAAPHVAGVVALLKALHPHWSHAALKSAIVTTASRKDEYDMPMLAEALPRKVADPFDYGGGNINPNWAADPGLIYDINPKDYNKFFACQIKKYEICNITTLPAYHLNLPSISIPDLRHPINVQRAVTNVGEVDAVYQSSIESPLGVKMTIEPPILVFNVIKKVHAFNVRITPLWKVQGDYTFGSLTWYNELHSARIPIVVRITIQDFYADLYIAYLGEKKYDDPSLVIASHHDMLTKVFQSKEEALASIVYSYKHGFSGFAAMLTEDQAEILAELPEVISLTPNKLHELMTTRSWDFLGLNYEPPSKLLRRSNYGEDVIIGMIDTGIWPESRSFSDHEYKPIPARWKGVCQLGEAWGPTNCSRKIIGARYYAAGMEKIDLKKNYMSARDMAGHGTHTASIAAGAMVEGVNLHGLGAGVARGGAPRARLAVYKVSWDTRDNLQIASAGVLAAIDDAIHDGVDILSLSLNVDENSFGALHAVQKRITVVYAGGNSGPRPQVIYNTAPWVITAAASKIDRSFPTTITLGNKQTIVGQSLYYKLKNESKSGFQPLLHGGSCSGEALNGTTIKGKIVLCVEASYGPIENFIDNIFQNVLSNGASGLIFALYTTDILLSTEDCLGIACVLVDIDIGFQVATYIGSQSVPVAKIEPAVSITGKEVPAPKVAIFSSRGPSIKYPTVLKPDIAAPGVNILAAEEDGYVFKSGTSMAAPHVAGVVALLKALHPHWSHAALKSAIVTSASTKDEYGMPILAEGLPRKVADPFDYGGGHINPNGAADPGLVYEIDPMDYSKFFACKIKKYEICNITTLPAYHLNLPSISIPELRHPIKVRRAVTNVGEVDAVYKSSIQSPLGVKISVEPPTLVFNAKNKVKTFKVSMTPLWKVQGEYTFGSLTWYNEHHTVRIPIAARITIRDFYADVA
uniref:Uncharacterized protein n=1 Tax=Leersia perrieri TaxID=77586 RepID=A0A0D9V6Q4_9ORYZ